MSDLISKALEKFPPKERERAKEILIRIENYDLVGLDVKKLKGYKNLFRVRIGSIRIVYEVKNGIHRALFVGHRNDTTYNL